MNKTLLMVAFDFPPSNAASIQRTLKFCEYLTAWGWDVHVLTAKPYAYPQIDSNQELSPAIAAKTYRAIALDVHRHLSIKGKHLSMTKIPDRWSSWGIFGLQLGKKIIKRIKPDVIWSTSPIPSAHKIARRLAEYGQAPWIADYRDPLPYMHFDSGSRLDKVHQQIDQQTLARANIVTFATPQAAILYQKRYGDRTAEKFRVIENGFDEGNFNKLQSLSLPSSPFSNEKFSLYYSGVLYPVGRDPRPLFEAMATLQSQGHINGDNFELVFQGSGDGDGFADDIKRLNIGPLIRFIEPVPFMRALYNMTQADALLLIQDKKFNAQIPGKIYEYLRTGRPILLKADAEGATAKIGQPFEGCPIANDADAIQNTLLEMITKGRQQHYARDVQQFTRESKAQQLDQLLLQLISG